MSETGEEALGCEINSQKVAGAAVELPDAACLPADKKLEELKKKAAAGPRAKAKAKGKSKGRGRGKGAGAAMPAVA